MEGNRTVDSRQIAQNSVHQGYLALAWMFCVSCCFFILLPGRWMRGRWLPLGIGGAVLAGLYFYSRFVNPESSLRRGSPGGIVRTAKYAFTGPLIHMGVVYGIVGVVFRNWKTREIRFALKVLLAMHLLLLIYMPWPGHATGRIEEYDNVAGEVDKWFFHWGGVTGYRYLPNRDHVLLSTHRAYGILTLMPAIAMVLFGMWVCRFVVGRSVGGRWLVGFAGVGLLLVLFGWVVSLRVPMSLSIFSLPLSLMSMGIGLVLLAGLLAMERLSPSGNWAWPLMVIGRNALVYYVIYSVLIRAITVVKLLGETLFRPLEMFMTQAIWIANNADWLLRPFSCINQALDRIALLYIAIVIFIMILPLHFMRIRLKV